MNMQPGSMLSKQIAILAITVVLITITDRNEARIKPDVNLSLLCQLMFSDCCKLIIINKFLLIDNTHIYQIFWYFQKTNFVKVSV